MELINICHQQIIMYDFLLSTDGCDLHGVGCHVLAEKFLWPVPSATREILFLSKWDFLLSIPLIQFGQKRNKHSFCWQFRWNAELHAKVFSPFELAHRWIHCDSYEILRQLLLLIQFYSWKRLSVHVKILAWV